MFRKLVPVSLCWTAAFTTPAIAHHSFAMFDATRTLTLDGTVKEFRWNNPHVFIQFIVTSPQGPQEWSIEMSSPLHLMRNGWKPGSLKAGDRVVIVVHPMRDGSAGGNYVSAQTPEGKMVGGPGAKRGDVGGGL